MKTTDWPRLPIQPEDLPKIRELLTAEEYEKLLERMEADPARWRPASLPRPANGGTASKPTHYL